MNGIILANIYRPFRATGVEPHHIYVPAAPLPARGLPALESLQPVLAQLRAGGEVTVVCWGDSVTVGLDVPDMEQTYVRRFEAALRARFASARIHFVNAGIDGSNTTGRLTRFQTEVLAYRPDIVTVEFINDMGLRADALPANYSRILEQSQRAGAALILITPHFSMPSWMPLPHGRGKDSRPGVAFLRQFARQNRVALADAAARWEELEALGLPYETLLANGINHPDARGHEFFVEELMRLFPR